MEQKQVATALASITEKCDRETCPICIGDRGRLRVIESHLDESLGNLDIAIRYTNWASALDEAGYNSLATELGEGVRPIHGYAVIGLFRGLPSGRRDNDTNITRHWLWQTSDLNEWAGYLLHYAKLYIERNRRMTHDGPTGEPYRVRPGDYRNDAEQAKIGDKIFKDTIHRPSGYDLLKTRAMVWNALGIVAGAQTYWNDKITS